MDSALVKPSLSLLASGFQRKSTQGSISLAHCALQVGQTLGRLVHQDIVPLELAAHFLKQHLATINDYLDVSSVYANSWQCLLFMLEVGSIPSQARVSLLLAIVPDAVVWNGTTRVMNCIIHVCLQYIANETGIKNLQIRWPACNLILLTKPPHVSFWHPGFRYSFTLASSPYCCCQHDDLLSFGPNKTRLTLWIWAVEQLWLPCIPAW